MSADEISTTKPNVRFVPGILEVLERSYYFSKKAYSALNGRCDSEARDSTYFLSTDVKNSLKISILITY